MNQDSVAERMDVPPATYTMQATFNSVICNATGAPVTIAQLLSPKFRSAINVASIELLASMVRSSEVVQQRDKRNWRVVAEFTELIAQHMDSLDTIILGEIDGNMLDSVGMVIDRPTNILRLKIDCVKKPEKLAQRKMLELEHLSCAHHDLEYFMHNEKIRKLFLVTYPMADESEKKNIEAFKFDKLSSVVNRNTQLTSIAAIYSVDIAIRDETYRMSTKDIVRELLKIDRDFDYFFVAIADAPDTFTQPIRFQEMFSFDRSESLLHVSHVAFVELCPPRQVFANLRIDFFDSPNEVAGLAKLVADWQEMGKHLNRLSIGISHHLWSQEIFEQITNLSISIVNSTKIVLEEIIRTGINVRLRVLTRKLLYYIRKDVQMIDITFDKAVDDSLFSVFMQRISGIDTLTELHLSVDKELSMDMTEWPDPAFRALHILYFNIIGANILADNPGLLDLGQLNEIFIHDDDQDNLYTNRLDIILNKLRTFGRTDWEFEINKLFSCIEGTKP